MPLRHPPIFPEFLQSMQPDHIDRAFQLKLARDKIENRDGWIWAMGQDMGSRRNNEALSFVQANDMARARSILEIVKKKAPQNFAARFNLGRIYLFFREHNKARIEFRQASLLMPQYWMNNFYLARSYELMGKYNEAEEQYRLSYRKNPYDLASLASLGNVYITQKRYFEAESVFRYCLRQDTAFNDALIGMGKLNFFSARYLDAVAWFRSVETISSYNKEYHYYYAESAFYARMYPLAIEEFQKMLAYPQDAIFNKVSLTRVRFRLNQARRLALRSE